MHTTNEIATNDAHDQNEQLTAGLGTAGILLGSVGFLYGAGTATERHGLAPWALLAAYLASAVSFAVAVHLVNRSRAAAPRSHTRIGQLFDSVIARLDWGGPVVTIALSAAVLWVGVASYGLIRLVQG